MDAFRQVYDNLPATIQIPETIQHKKAEVIILLLSMQEGESKSKTPIWKLAGGLEKGVFSSKSPLQLQKDIRDEWI